MMDKELEDLERTKQKIKKIWEDVRESADIEPSYYIMPKVLYDQIVKKVTAVERKLNNQTISLKTHLKEKQELRHELKKMQKEKEKK